MTDLKVREVAAALIRGGVALVPTDTVYGLAARPDMIGAILRIFRMKKRPDNLNLQILLPERMQVGAIGAVSGAAEALLNRKDLAAGITFILPLATNKKPDWLGERSEAGIRIPGDSRIQAVLDATGPLFATSANVHGHPPGRTCDEILAQLDGAPDAVWDVGPLGGVASTVVDFNAAPPKVLRWGVVEDLTEFGLGHA